MEPKKVYLNLWVEPATKQALEREARRENRSLSNLSSLLLQWAIRSMERTGGFHELLARDGLPAQIAAQAEMEAAVASEADTRKKRRA